MYIDKEAPYRLPWRRAAILLAFAIYTYWALIGRDHPDKLPPAFLMPAFIGLVAWLILLFIDFKNGLVEKNID